MQAGHPRRLARAGRLAALTIPAVLALALAPQAGSAQQTYTPERRTDIPGDLPPEDLKMWVYDKASGAYQPAEGDASQPYVPNPRAFPEGTVIGFAEGLAAIPFSHVINEDVYTYADELGYTVAYCDNNFDEALAVSCAETITQQSPNFVIESNWQAGVAQKVMDIFDAAKIPAVSDGRRPPQRDLPRRRQLDVAASSPGKAAGKQAEGLGHCADAWILLGVNPGEGDAANERLSGFKDGVQDDLRRHPRRPHRRSSCSMPRPPTQSLTMATDWLTAHPQAAYVLSIHHRRRAQRRRDRGPHRRAAGTASPSARAATTSASRPPASPCREPLPGLRGLLPREVRRLRDLHRGRCPRGQARAPGGPPPARLPRREHDRLGLPSGAVGAAARLGRRMHAAEEARGAADAARQGVPRSRCPSSSWRASPSPSARSWPSGT